MDGMSAMAMSGMSAAGWSLASAGLFLAVWTIMMAAMMLPAAAPMIVVFATAQAGRGRPTAVPTWIFVAGYLLVWVVTGAAVYVVVQVGTEAATLLPLQTGPIGRRYCSGSHWSPQGFISSLRLSAFA